jgi:predicted permease
VPETGFIFLFLFALAGCTEPVALVSTGVFIAIQKNPAACGWSAIALYMVVKLVLVPMVAIGCAVCVSLTGSYARAVVLIASLPIPGTSNIFSTKYSLLRDETVANIVFGTILVLPTSLAWIAIMDASGLFQVSESASTTTPIVC